MSAAEDYGATRRLRGRRGFPAADKPKLRYLFAVCPKCNYAWTVGTDIPGDEITVTCSQCGAEAKAKK